MKSTMSEALLLMVALSNVSAPRAGMASPSSGSNAVTLTIPVAPPGARQATWRYWGLSIASIEDQIRSQCAERYSRPEDATKKAECAQAYFDSMFGPDGLNFNMIRYDIGSDPNPVGVIRNFDKRDVNAQKYLDKVLKNNYDVAGSVSDFKRWLKGQKQIIKLCLDPSNDNLVTNEQCPAENVRWTWVTSKNRGVCDVGSNPAWQFFDPEFTNNPENNKVLYCNATLYKHCGGTSGITCKLLSRDIYPCYLPRVKGWYPEHYARETARRIINHESLTPLTMPGTINGDPVQGAARTLLKNAVSAITQSGQTPIVEAEIVGAPFDVMDSGCQSGNYRFFGSKTKTLSIDSISDPQLQKRYAHYVANAIGKLNADLNGAARISEVGAMNAFGYDYKFADSRDTRTSGAINLKSTRALGFYRTLKEELTQKGLPDVGVTGLDDDKLAMMRIDTATDPGFGASANKFGAYGTFFTLLDAAVHGPQIDFDYFNIHAASQGHDHGPLLREMSALSKYFGKPVSITGQGCCDQPWAWDGPGQVLESRNSAPFAYVPNFQDGIFQNYPVQDPNNSEAPNGKRADYAWLGADKQASTMMEMIKYLGATGWHFLGVRWGMLATPFEHEDKQHVTHVDVIRKPPYHVIKEFMRAIPPNARLVPVGNNHTLAARYQDSAGNHFLSLVVYNGIFKKEVPGALPDMFAKASIPVDTYAGWQTIKDIPADLDFTFDLKSYDLKLDTPVSMTQLNPNREDCPENTEVYHLQRGKHSVDNSLHFGGCRLVKSEALMNLSADKMLHYAFPAHGIYFVRIPLNSDRNIMKWAPVHVDDQDAAVVRISTPKHWKASRDIPLQFYDMSKKVVETVKLAGKEFYRHDVYQRTFTESKSVDSRVLISLSPLKNSDSASKLRLRVTALRRPVGAVIQVEIRKKATQTVVKSFKVNTYAEYWQGNSLLFDTGDLPNDDYQITLSGIQREKSLSLDRLSSNGSLQVDFQ